MANPEHLAVLKNGVEAWNEWITPPGLLRLADLSHADLSGATLSGATLERVNLDTADLSRANLSQADLSRANLGYANLSHADLSGAKLNYANLNHAELNHAELSGANLNYANLSHAELSGANLMGAELYFTVFANVDLTTTLGLDSCTHYGPSSIDQLTLERFVPPDVFLKGVGFSGIDIANIPAIVGGDACQHCSCFISYSHVDKPFARRLHDGLQVRGIRCWLDEKRMRPGDHVFNVVNDAIRLHDMVLLCASEASLTSWWVHDELTATFEKEDRDGRHVLIPLNIDGYLLQGRHHPDIERARTRLAADFVGWEKDDDRFETELGKVVAALRTHEPKRQQ